jgi:hypothetical protein
VVEANIIAHHSDRLRPSELALGLYRASSAVVSLDPCSTSQN